MPAADLRFLAKVSSLYYEEELTQSEIADRLRISRSGVSRLLKQARELGVVQISITQPAAGAVELERRLEHRYGLLEAVVVSGDTGEEGVIERVGVAGADYLHRILHDDDVVGVAWGRTLHRLIMRVPPAVAERVSCVQLLGGLTDKAQNTDPAQLVTRLGEVLRAASHVLRAPVFVDSAAYETLTRMGVISSVMELYNRLTIALLGIGPVGPTSPFLSSGALSLEEMDRLAAAGAVGECCGHFFDANGQLIDGVLTKRLIGVSAAQLRQAPRVVALAGGLHKVGAVRSLLASGLLKVLITDDQTAAVLGA